MGKADKKQRHRAKREAKRREIRRKDSISPLKRLADAPGEVECWMSTDFESFGQAQMFVFKKGAGISGVACFLVDQGVVGVKDAWYRIGVDHSEFEKMVDTCKRQGVGMRRVDVDIVRRMVAGGIRWAHENGMRLPKDLAKTSSLIGGVDDWATADVSNFVKEFAGHPEDLRRRLVGQSFDDYIERDDISFTFSDLAPVLDQETGDYLESGDEEDFDDDTLSEAGLDDDLVDLLGDRFLPVAIELAKETAAWVIAKDQSPSTELLEGWMSVFLSRLISKASMPDATDEETAERGFELIETLLLRVGPERRPELHAAVEQVLAHLLTDPSMVQSAILRYLPDDTVPEAE